MSIDDYVTNRRSNQVENNNQGEKEIICDFSERMIFLNERFLVGYSFIELSHDVCRITAQFTFDYRGFQQKDFYQKNFHSIVFVFEVSG